MRTLRRQCPIRNTKCDQRHRPSTAVTGIGIGDPEDDDEKDRGERLLGGPEIEWQGQSDQKYGGSDEQPNRSARSLEAFLCGRESPFLFFERPIGLPAA